MTQKNLYYFVDIFIYSFESDSTKLFSVQEYSRHACCEKKCRRGAGARRAVPVQMEIQLNWVEPEYTRKSHWDGGKRPIKKIKKRIRKTNESSFASSSSTAALLHNKSKSTFPMSSLKNLQDQHWMVHEMNKVNASLFAKSNLAHDFIWWEYFQKFNKVSA